MAESFETKLETCLSKVQACQERKGKKSCLQCSLVLDCPDRKAYVQSVYTSMNKGQEGNFDF
ncbi:hypothetical protein [Helicobacter suis]|uniref:Uncharacterized protein n=1 Tax=Helicobacter suis TaxID=104628 RepID=A0A6J4CXZ5_9HELI|nr:hypothetical protein [Helicobacter suis]BCD45248.1 Hypothetical protein NHP190020_02870 [Helicobacter suis]BCD47021.1 Hypothetical protein NHP194003_02250 [Helicobacter suis]BCD48777.1 Hypothetical protein NHP194004_02240 [Helicobacter suis]BCD50558.1 Hypothetical protein NHP194022_02290 [Helicobacter suis]BCD69583.1 Hypothetical protein SNTW_02280 [Helicobacter suis]